MNTLNVIALVIVISTGVYLLGLGVVAIFDKRRAAHFLESFASSAFAHYLELMIRLVVGFAFVIYSIEMPFSTEWRFFGWVIVASTVCLFLIPWQWHHRFAQRSVPHAIRYLKLFGAVSFALGIFVITCALHGAIY